MSAATDLRDRFVAIVSDYTAELENKRVTGSDRLEHIRCMEGLCKCVVALEDKTASRASMQATWALYEQLTGNEPQDGKDDQP